MSGRRGRGAWQGDVNDEWAQRACKVMVRASAAGHLRMARRVVSWVQVAPVQQALVSRLDKVRLVSVWVRPGVHQARTEERRTGALALSMALILVAAASPVMMAPS